MPGLQHVLDPQFAGILDELEMQGVPCAREVIGRPRVDAAFRYLHRLAQSRYGDNITGNGACPPGIAFPVTVKIDVE